MKNLLPNRQNLVGLLLGKMVRVQSKREQNEAQFKPIYTPRASQVFALAEREALRLNCDSIDLEHVLLGLVNFGQGIAVDALRRMGLDLEQVRLKIEGQVTGGAEIKTHHPIELTPSVKKVLVRVQDEARSLPVTLGLARYSVVVVNLCPSQAAYDNAIALTNSSR